MNHRNKKIGLFGIELFAAEGLLLAQSGRLGQSKMNAELRTLYSIAALVPQDYELLRI